MGRVDTGPEEIVGNQAAALYCGVSAVSTWRAYVARDQAPKPDRREIRGGHAIPVWNRSTLDQYNARPRRPGAGTDLETPADAQPPAADPQQQLDADPDLVAQMQRTAADRGARVRRHRPTRKD